MMAIDAGQNARDRGGHLGLRSEHRQLRRGRAGILAWALFRRTRTAKPT